MSQTSKPQTTPLSCRVDNTLYKDMEQIAAAGDRTLSQEVRRALTAHVQKYKQLRSLGKKK